VGHREQQRPSLYVQAATFANAYAKTRAIAPQRLVMIGEFPSTEDGGDTASDSRT
jgi:hypothetical protein